MKEARWRVAACFDGNKDSPGTEQATKDPQPGEAAHGALKPEGIPAEPPTSISPPIPKVALAPSHPSLEPASVSQCPLTPRSDHSSGFDKNTHPRYTQHLTNTLPTQLMAAITEEETKSQ